MQNWNIRLKQARINKKLSLKDVTKEVNIIQQSLIEYEKGNIFPKLDMLVFLCELYEISPNYVVYGNNSGLKLENDIQREMETLISLIIYQKIEYENKNDSFTVRDKYLKKYINYFLEFLNNNSKYDLKIIERIIYAINKLKD